MSQRNRFRPVVWNRLESRVALTQLAGIAPATVAPLNLSNRVRNLNVAAVDQINQAFDRFTQDFLQAQGAYFASSQTQSAGDVASAKIYFRSFLVQRVNLLAQELTNVFVQLPGGVRRGSPNGPPVVQSFLRQRINGPASSTLTTQLAGRGPSQNQIPNANTAGSAATLYTSFALTTIDTARATTLNASGYLLKGTFSNGHK